MYPSLVSTANYSSSTLLWDQNQNEGKLDGHVKGILNIFVGNESDRRKELFIFFPCAHTILFSVALRVAIFSPSPQAGNLKICQGFTIVKLKWTLPSFIMA